MKRIPVLFLFLFLFLASFGVEITKTYEFKDFDEVRIGHTFEISVTKGPEYKVEVISEEKYMDNIDVGVDGDELYIDYEWEFFSWGNHSKRIKVNIVMPHLSKATFSGASLSSIKGFEEEELKIEISGASESDIEINSEELKLEVSGASKCKLTGDALNFHLEISGASELDSFKFSADNIKADLSGASSAKVNAVKILDVIASGASTLEFKGNAKVTEDVSGASSIKKITG
ncbi:MAG: hypothetical protein COC01_04695 [Bacteroidetes bacterium]|nr:DUF2807 domain-containing protein [Bacteroidia bacterium]PCH67967.1 MAG: hypothetical protein COC01_04695 [Bacteroidota bacterium]